MTAASDPRWQTLNSAGYQCSCGEKHVGLFPIHIDVPIGWPHSRTPESDAAVRLDRDFLSDSYSVHDGHPALRCRLPLEIAGVPNWAFTFTVWARVTRPDFEDYLAAKKAGKLRGSVGVRARLMNRLTGFPDTSGLLGTAFQDGKGGWPELQMHGPQDGIHTANHPLIRQQHDGVGMDRVFELFAGYGHDMKAAAGKR